MILSRNVTKLASAHSMSKDPRLSLALDEV